MSSEIQNNQEIAVIFTPRKKIFILTNTKTKPAYPTKGTNHVIGIDPETGKKVSYTGWCKIKQIIQASTK